MFTFTELVQWFFFVLGVMTVSSFALAAFNTWVKMGAEPASDAPVELSGKTDRS